MICVQMFENCDEPTLNDVIACLTMQAAVFGPAGDSYQRSLCCKSLILVRNVQLHDFCVFMESTEDFREIPTVRLFCLMCITLVLECN